MLLCAAMANDIKDRITQASQTFVNDIVSIFANAFANTASGLADSKPGRGAAKQAAAKPVKGKPGRPAKAAKAQPAPKAESGKRVRRTEADLAKMGEDVVKLLQKNKGGLRMEAINAELGTDTKTLMRPMMKLFEDNRIRKEGERRATTYFAK
jgi:hypothetical protein